VPINFEILQPSWRGKMSGTDSYLRMNTEVQGINISTIFTWIIYTYFYTKIHIWKFGCIKYGNTAFQSITVHVWFRWLKLYGSHRCPLIKFQLTLSSHRKCDWSWMSCGNMIWVYLLIRITMQFLAELWDERAPSKCFDHCINLMENVVKVECSVVAWRDIHAYGLHHAIHWLTVR
jgi:hypothetical protein